LQLDIGENVIASKVQDNMITAFVFKPYNQSLSLNRTSSGKIRIYDTHDYIIRNYILAVFGFVGLATN